MKKLMKDIIILNADDYGYNETTNNGIIDLILARKINSISVIINGDGIQTGVTKIKQIWKEKPILRRELSIGLHFNLSQGSPISSQCLKSQIVQNQRFITKPRIYDILQNTDICLDQAIRSQFSTQLRRFVLFFGRKPSHIDGHNHIHIIPAVAANIAKQMSSMGISRTRIPYEDLQNITIKLNNRFLLYAQKSKSIFQSYNILFTNDFIGLESFGNLKAQLIERSLQKQQNMMQRSVEMMCHPAYPSDSGTEWTKSIDRLKEKQQLESKQFESLLLKYPDYGNYYDLMPRNIEHPSVLINYPESIFMDEFKRNQVRARLEELGFFTHFLITLQNEEPQLSSLDLKINIQYLDISILIQISSMEIKINSPTCLDVFTKDKLTLIIKKVLEKQQKESKKQQIQCISASLQQS